MYDETTKEIILGLAAREYGSPKSDTARPDDALLHAIHLIGKHKELVRYDWEELLERLYKIIARRSGGNQ